MDIDKLNVVVDALVVVGMEHTSSAERNEVACVRNRASSAGRIKSPICERIGAQDLGITGTPGEHLPYWDQIPYTRFLFDFW